MHTLNKFRLRLSCVRKYLSLDLENWWNTLSFNTTYHITMYILYIVTFSKYHSLVPVYGNSYFFKIIAFYRYGDFDHKPSKRWKSKVCSWLHNSGKWTLLFLCRCCCVMLLSEPIFVILRSMICSKVIFQTVTVRQQSGIPSWYYCILMT